MTKSVRFRTWFESEWEASQLDGKSAVVEITAEQVVAVAALYDELTATATAWSGRLAAVENAAPPKKLFIEADMTFALPFVVGPPGKLILGREEMELEIAPDDEPFDDPPRVTWGVRIDAGWSRVYVYAAGGAQAPMPLDDLRRHFDLDAPETSAKPVTRVAFDRLVDLYRQMGDERKAADAEIARLTAELDAAIGRPVDEFLFGWPSEPVQLILNAVRGTKGDRWPVWLGEPVGGGLPSIVKDELVAGWRRPVEKSS